MLYIVSENLAKLYSTVGWKTKLVNNKLGYFTEEHSRECMEDASWFLIWGLLWQNERERDKSEKELLSKKEPSFDNLEDS